MSNNSNIGNQAQCPICTVKITKLLGQDRVTFATGATATREELWQRVCQHVKGRPGCLNQQGQQQ